MNSFSDFILTVERNIGREIPTIGGRSAFTVDLIRNAIIITPLSTRTPRSISFDLLHQFFEEYEKNNRSKSPSEYSYYSRNSSYILALLNLQENESAEDTTFLGCGVSKRIRLVSHISFPVWSIVHYLDRFSSTYFKLLTIQRVCDALSNGSPLDDLIVAEHPAELITTTPFEFDRNSPFKTLTAEEDGYTLFWDLVKNIHRPMVFVKKDGNFQPLINIYQDDLIINRLVVSSPPDFTLTGVGESISDLYYASEREERLRQEHRSRQINHAVQNIGEMASTQQKINNANLAGGHKLYLEAILDDLLIAQVELNKQMGIQPKGINTRA